MSLDGARKKKNGRKEREIKEEGEKRELGREGDGKGRREEEKERYIISYIIHVERIHFQ